VPSFSPLASHTRAVEPSRPSDDHGTVNEMALFVVSATRSRTRPTAEPLAVATSLPVPHTVT
jgi:hypothetical protein